MNYCMHYIKIATTIAPLAVMLLFPMPNTLSVVIPSIRFCCAIITKAIAMNIYNLLNVLLLAIPLLQCVSKTLSPLHVNHHYCMT